MKTKDGSTKGANTAKQANDKNDSEGRPTDLWQAWWALLEPLRSSCARTRSFLWMAVAILGFTVRTDLHGVTSHIRASFTGNLAYRSLLNLFHSSAIKINELTHCWTRQVTRLFRPLEESGHLVLVADGLKIGKEGRRMPAVKSLHQESQNNSKAPYIMGHSFQAIGLLARAAKSVVCVPLASRIHEGLKRSPNEKGTLLDRLVGLLFELTKSLKKPVILLADAYYASRTVILPLLDAGHHLVTRVRTNAVAYQRAPTPKTRKRGRPRMYGTKVRLNDLWNHPGFTDVTSPAYGETGITIQVLVQDLLWRPVGRIVRFVLVDHPVRGRIILMTTMTTMEAVDVVRLYSYRFKIEVSFKAAVHTLGAYAYRFWLKAMPKQRRRGGDQHLHRATKEYRERVWKKVAAYELHVQMGLIAQGLLQCLAVTHTQSVWARFRSWMRTMDTDAVPSEAVVAQALRASLPEFLLGKARDAILPKFVASRIDPTRLPGFTLTNHPG